MSRFHIKSLAIAALAGFAILASPVADAAGFHPGRPAPQRAAPRVFQQRAFQPRFVQPRFVQPRVVQRFSPAPRAYVAPAFVRPGGPRPGFVRPGFAGPGRVFAGHPFRHDWHGRRVWFGLGFPAVYQVGYVYDGCWQSVMTPWGWGWINLCDPYWDY